MATIQRFEDVLGWQRARELTRQVYEFTCEDLFSKDFALRDQIRRASISIMLNIAEGFARRTDKDFARFLSNAHGSAAEVQSALYVALDQGYINDAQFKSAYVTCDECSRLVQGFSNFLLRADLKTPDSRL
ncbi:MAG TPA: four helix bundle protein [Planctomycetota bacterium]|nr:four helix bundle protein [Planctomycetota bacterium]